MSDKVKEFKYGLMEVCTKVGGKTTKPMGRDVSFMLMETSTTGFGRMIRPMASEFTLTWMEQDTKATGKKISNTERALSPGLMVLTTRETM